MRELAPLQDQLRTCLSDPETVGPQWQSQTPAGASEDAGLGNCGIECVVKLNDALVWVAHPGEPLQHYLSDLYV